MDINDIWNNIQPSAKGNTAEGVIKKLGNIKSTDPLEKIKANLVINIVWGILICILYVVVFFVFDILYFRIAMSIVLIFSLWIVFTAYKLYTSLRSKDKSTHHLLGELQYHYYSLLKWIKNQEKVGIFIYPISMTGGFFLGGVIGSGKTVEAFMSKPLMWAVLIGCILVLTPLCYWLVKVMFKYSFGSHLQQLKANIDELTAEK